MPIDSATACSPLNGAFPEVYRSYPLPGLASASQGGLCAPVGCLAELVRLFCNHWTFWLPITSPTFLKAFFICFDVMILIFEIHNDIIIILYIGYDLTMFHIYKVQDNVLAAILRLCWQFTATNKKAGEFLAFKLVSKQLRTNVFDHRRDPLYPKKSEHTAPRRWVTGLNKNFWCPLLMRFGPKPPLVRRAWAEQQGLTAGWCYYRPFRIPEPRILMTRGGRGSLLKAVLGPEENRQSIDVYWNYVQENSNMICALISEINWFLNLYEFGFRNRKIAQPTKALS